MSCYANLQCLKNIFGANLPVFYKTWNNILTNVSKPSNIDFIPINPGIVIHGSDDKINWDISSLQSILTHQFTKKITLIVTPVYFYDFSKTGRDRNHFCAMYIYFDKNYRNSGNPKISINYFNPHGILSSRQHDEYIFLNHVKYIIGEIISVTNKKQLRLNIPINIYNGPNLQEMDPMGLCIFWGFFIMAYYINRVSELSNGYDIEINALCQEIIDRYVYGNTECEALKIIENILIKNIAIQVGSGSKNNNIESQRKQIINYIKYQAFNIHLQIVADFLGIKDKKYLRRTLIKNVKNVKEQIISKLYKKIFE